MSRTVTLSEWRTEAIERFGPPEAWAFVCPCCGHRQTVQDYRDAGAPEAAVGFSCVGRWAGAKREALGEGEGPCNYAGAGLFKLNPVRVMLSGSRSIDAFEWADA